MLSGIVVTGDCVRQRLPILVVSLLLVAPGAALRAQSSCDRDCLVGHMSAYLSALVRHAPADLPLAPNVRFVENGQALPLNKALWATASGVRDYRIDVADAEAGQVAMLGVLEENDIPVIAAVRLRIEAGSITEIEHIVARVQGRTFGNIDAMVEPRPGLLEVLPPTQRRGRDELIAAADSYFSGLDEENSDEHVAFDPACHRIENGVQTANAQDPDAGGMRAMGCAEQFATGFSLFITDIRERRYPVVDVDRGLVFAIVFFDHAGNVETFSLKDGSSFTVGEAYRVPRTWMIGEIFKVVDGRIREIEAVLVDVPYRMPSGW
jgi:hypothetical protein